MDDMLAGLCPEELRTRVLCLARLAEAVTVTDGDRAGVYYRELGRVVLALDAALRRGEPWPLAWAGDRQRRPVADVPLPGQEALLPQPAVEPS